MHKIKKITKNWILAFIYPRPIIGLFYLPKYIKNLFQYKLTDKYNKITFADLQPCLGDWTTSTPFDAHYFYQGAWLARKLKQINTSEHVDIASSVLTISVLSGFVNTIFVDYRPLKVNLDGLKSIPGDVLNLPFESKSQNSISCLHVIEHIGLGRYGDALDANGSVKAAQELQRILSADGHLYIAMPIGRERICFNAHRVHSPTTVLLLFSQLELVDFSFVDDEGVFHQNTSFNFAENLEYGCGLFHFKNIT